VAIKFAMVKVVVSKTGPGGERAWGEGEFWVGQSLKRPKQMAPLANCRGRSDAPLG